jgi:hypothetical protein
MGEYKIRNLFHHCLEKDELVEFICGKGEYLVTDREYGGHWPLGSYKKYIEPDLPDGLFPDEFWEKLSSSFDTTSNLNIFLDNLTAYFIPYYNASDESLKKLRANCTPLFIVQKIKSVLSQNKESLLIDKRGTGIEWNSKSGLWGSITSNLQIIRKRGGPNFLTDEFV